MSWAESGDTKFSPPVWFEPCLAYRIPLEGDLLTCGTCGYWIEEHDA